MDPVMAVLCIGIPHLGRDPDTAVLLKGIPRMCQIVLGILDTAASTMGSPTCVLTRQFPIGTCPRVCKLVVFN